VPERQLWVQGGEWTGDHLHPLDGGGGADRLRRAVVDLEEGGRLLAWIGDTIEDVEIGMPVQVVPRIFEEVEEIRVYYTVEQPGTTWGKAPSAG
jgi:hypothetical protein